MSKKDNNKNLKSIVFLIVIIALGILIYNTSFATTDYASLENLLNWGKVGDTLLIGFKQSGNAQLAVDDGNNPDNLYCIQHGNNNLKPVTYGVVHKLSIDGTVAKIIDNNGNVVKETNKISNAILAYILGGGNYQYGYGTGNNAYTDRQRTLWSYWSEWLSISGNELGLSGWRDSKNDTAKAVQKLKDEAENYAYSNNLAQITSNVGLSIDTDNNNAGPFNVTYSGKISSIVVKDVDGNEITENLIFIQNNKQVSVSNIVSNKDFYIKNGSGKIIKDVTINVTNSNDLIKVDILFLNHTSNQKLIAVRPQNTTSTQTASVNISLEPTNTLRVVKYGVTNNNKEVKQQKVGFVIFREGSGYLKYNKTESKELDIGKAKYNKNNFSWKDNKNDATIFETSNTEDGWTGYFQIENIPTGTYYIGEVYNRNKGYETSIITNAKLEKYKNNDLVKTDTIKNISRNDNISGYNNKLQVMKIEIQNDGYIKVLRVYDSNKQEDKAFNIDIIKKNTSKSEKLSGAEFRIKVIDKNNKVLGWLEKLSNTEYDYDAKYKDATIWSTTKTTNKKASYIYASTKGEIEIENLNADYKYEIYETKSADNCMVLSRQISNGMTVEINDKKSKDIEYIKAKASSTKSNKYAATDASIYCGEVSYEENGRNVEILVTNRPESKYESNNSGSSKKYLNISGKIWRDQRQGKQEEYNDLYDSDSENLYKESVKVSLINSTGKTVKTDTTNSGVYNISTGISVTKSTSKDTISKKLDGYYLKFEYSNRYTPVSPLFAKENGSKALMGMDENQDIIEGVSYIYNLSDYVNAFYEYKILDHMNMGLIKQEEPEFQINQNIAYVKVEINGYTYTYEYGETGNTAKTSAPTVNWQNSYAFTRAIYPSDIAYSSENLENNLKVYVVYRIDIINNESSHNYGKTKTTKYGHKTYVEIDLEVKSLTNKYDTDRYELANDKTEEDFGNWEDNNNDGIATYKGDIENIDPKESNTVYIQFKVKQEVLTKLLTNTELYDKVPTIATVQAYHNYWRTYEIDGDNQNSNLVSKDKKTSTFEKTAQAFYLKLKLNKERTITGIVFKDNNTSSNGEVLGNGMYDKDEKTIQGIQVELITENGETAKTYSSDKSFAEEYAKTISGENGKDGTFTIKGITPGKYKVKFTYGDGTVKIADYKSTIIKDDCIKNAIQNNSLNEEWYKHTDSCENKILYNTATDDIKQREEYNNNKSRKEIDAKTPLMEIGVENTKDDIATVTSEFEEGIRKELIEGINFGIIEIPEISLSFDKVVSNIQITNTQGNILVEGNPATQNIKYVSNLDELDHSMVKGSKYTKSEINEDELYGSKLKLTYSITVQNNSQVNYYEDNGSDYYGYYYKFGDSEHSKEVTIKVDNVLDYIDPVIKYQDISIDNNHKITQIKVTDNQEITDNIQAKTGLTYSYAVDITDWNELYTTKHKKEDNNNMYSIDKTQDTAELTVSRLLSSKDDDLGVSNVAQVSKIHVTNTPALVETVDASKIYFNDPIYTNPSDEVYVTITPPTGTDRLTTIIYVIVEIIALSVLTAGIILIKKKVIDK